MSLYQAASWDTHVDGCRPGAQLLMAVALGYSDQFSNLGCLNDRAVRGSTAVPSLHREGRAIDIGCDADDDTARDAMERFLGRLIAASPNAEIVQQCIFNRGVWTVGVGWRAYNGVDDHRSHAHIELTWHAAETLDLETLSAALTENDMTLAELAHGLGDRAHLGDDGVIYLDLINDDLTTYTAYPLGTAILFLHQELKMRRLAG